MHIRAFNGTLRDAQAIIEVDRATYGDCHYTPGHIIALESDPRQRAWVAEEAGRIVGFVSAFPTHSLAAGRWEVDELAVHPAAQGRGIGTALVAHAIADRIRGSNLSQARALVATNNLPSQRVFTRNGFSSIAQVHMLLYQVSGRVPRPRQVGQPGVRAAQVTDVPAIAEQSGCAVARIAAQLCHPDNLYLVAERGQRVLGYVELIHVRTLQYEGFWLESLAVAGWDRHAASRRCAAPTNQSCASVLFNAAIEEAKSRDTIDEVGYLVSPGEHHLYAACVGQGFRKVNEYLIFVREFNTR